MKRLICMLTVICMIAVTFAACNHGAGETEQTTASEPAGDQTTAGQEEQSADLPIIVGGKSEYVIVYPASDTKAKMLATELQNRIAGAFDVTLALSDDRAAEVTCEILVGKTNRAQSAAAADLLFRDKDYVCRSAGKKLVICGATKESLEAGIQYFVTTYTFSVKDKSTLTHLAAKDRTFDGGYDVNLVRVAGEHLSRFSIVYPKNSSRGEYYAALNLSYHLKNKAGMDIPVKNDAAPATGKEIRIGAVNRTDALTAKDGKFFVAVKDGNLCVAASDFFGFLDADVYLTDTLFAKSNRDRALKSDFSYEGNATKAPQRSAAYRVMFNNVWGVETPVRNRMTYAAAFYLAYDPDVIGLQEFFAGARNEGSLVKTLEENGYAEVNVGSANIIPVFYKTSRLKVVEAKRYDFVAVESLGITMVVFEDKSTADRFIYMATHFAGNVPDDATGIALRAEQANDLMAELPNITAKYPNVPIMMGGDYNSSARGFHEALDILREGGWKDCRSLAQIKDSECSCHGYPVLDKNFGYYVAPTYAVEGTDYMLSIDHIYQYGEGLEIQLFDVLGTEYAALFSDHFPLLMEFDLS